MKTYDERTQCVKDKLNALNEKKKRQKNVLWAAVITVMLLVLLIPYPRSPRSVHMYQDSPYYALIQKINVASFEPPAYFNNAHRLFVGFGRTLLRLLPIAYAPDKGGDAVNGMEYGQYAEVTDNQVAGVIEADLIKRSDRYIYYLKGTLLQVYSIEEEFSKKVRNHRVAGFTEQDAVDEHTDFAYVTASEMYLSQDCRTVTLLLDGYHKEIGSCITIVNLDVTDPRDIQETGRVYVTGNYNSSRMVDGEIFLFYSFKVSGANVDYSDATTFVPSYGQPGEMKCIPAEDIVSPELPDSARYTVISIVDGDTLAVDGITAFLSYSEELYVSEDTIFATRGYTDIWEGSIRPESSSCAMTEISAVGYGNGGMEYLGSVSVKGSVKDQYSMDQQGDILRVVTSVSYSGLIESDSNHSVNGETGVRNHSVRNASLYCISMEDWRIVASVEEFAPDRESAESVRFDGDYAYVCTARVAELTDPVFFFDLSDLNNITYKDTGTISGYSTSLVNLGEGYLMGIGFGESRQLKIEIYEETEESVASVCSYEYNCNFSADYKAYLIDRENNMVGMQVYDWYWGQERYILLHFDGYEIHEVLNMEFDADLDAARAVLIDGYLYMFGDRFEVRRIGDLGETGGEPES